MRPAKLANLICGEVELLKLRKRSSLLLVSLGNGLKLWIRCLDTGIPPQPLLATKLGSLDFKDDFSFGIFFTRCVYFAWISVLGSLG